MGLVTKKKKVPVVYESDIAARIQQRRLQLLVHSYLYYELQTTLISDQQWDKWAKELVVLQNENPAIADKVVYANEFRGFDGTTGFDLPYKDDDTIRRANRLLKIKGGKCR